MEGSCGQGKYKSVARVTHFLKRVLERLNEYQRAIAYDI
jgi:hypothetical protein